MPKPKHERRAQRYAVKARAIRDLARDRLQGHQLVEILSAELVLTEEHRYRLQRDLIRLVNGRLSAIVVMPRLTIVAELHMEDRKPGDFGLWSSGRFRLIDGPDVHVQPAWRRVKRSSTKRGKTK